MTEDERLIEEALHCADVGEATHWPTAAGYLADEVRRLRAIEARAERLSRIDQSGWGVDKTTLHWIGRWLKHGDDNEVLTSPPVAEDYVFTRKYMNDVVTAEHHDNPAIVYDATNGDPR